MLADDRAPKLVCQTRRHAVRIFERQRSHTLNRSR
jgi:hypothetical protein